MGNPAPHRSPNRRGNVAVSALSIVAIGFFSGLAVSFGCATSDQQMELQRELDIAKKNAAERRPAECHPGVTEPCYSGPEGTAARGICKAGTRTCDGDGFWQECVGEQPPAAREMCNGIDDDCNGIVDDGFKRQGTKCWTGSGACKSEGYYRCSADGTKSECDAPAVQGSEEICDGKDNDCDGQIDEGDIKGTGESCATGRAGMCKQGTRKCMGGEIKCVSNHTPTIEICNKQDDDCDNQIDEDCVTKEEAAAAKK
jgi:hypothetical protein